MSRKRLTKVRSVTILLSRIKLDTSVGCLLAKWISGVDTEHLEIIREEAQLFEGAYQRIVI